MSREQQKEYDHMEEERKLNLNTEKYIEELESKTLKFIR